MFDLVIRGGRNIAGDPVEVGVIDGKIAAVGPRIEGEAAREMMLEPGQYLSAGWIDDHVHCFQEMSLYYDYPDEIGYKKGVCTVVDAGTTGADNIARFHEVASSSITNVFALVNIAKTGIVAQDELSDTSRIQEDLVRGALEDNAGFAVGIKARMSASVVKQSGVEPLRMAKRIQRDLGGVPLMVHIGSEPPRLEDVLALMGEGDILTHCFNGKRNGIADLSDASAPVIKQFARAAYESGVVFDVGHGTDSFNFDVAALAHASGIDAASISTDIYIRNRTAGPVYDLATTMEKLRLVGYGWEQIIAAVTSVPARNLRLKGKGALEPEADADLTVFELCSGTKKLVDSNGNERTAHELVVPVRTILKGVSYDCQL